MVSFSFFFFEFSLVLLFFLLIERLELFVFLQKLLVVELFGLCLLHLFLLGPLLLGEIADKAFVLGKSLLLLSCLLFLFQLHLEGPSFLAELFETLLFLLAFSLFLTDELFGHFGFYATRVKIILADYLQSPVLSMLVQLKLH